MKTWDSFWMKKETEIHCCEFIFYENSNFQNLHLAPSFFKVQLSQKFAFAAEFISFQNYKLAKILLVILTNENTLRIEEMSQRLSHTKLKQKVNPLPYIYFIMNGSFAQVDQFWFIDTITQNLLSFHHVLFTTES